LTSISISAKINLSGEHMSKKKKNPKVRNPFATSALLRSGAGFHKVHNKKEASRKACRGRVRDDD
jgi:hypothetical protein